MTSPAPSQSIEPGAIVGSVRLSQPLEAGGMGTVWIGEHLTSRQAVAVKFMLADFANEDPTARERFDREARVLDRVNHPHIVRLFEKGNLEDGTPYIVMELLSGESFVERLERTCEPMTLKQVTTLLEQVCDALDYIHSMGILHRDLKGENTYLVGTSDAINVKIIDFGLAKTPDLPGEAKLTMPGSQIGSPEYMSPEQVLGSADLSEQADLWAVAVLAYVALTLQFPFQSENLADLLNVVRSGEYEPVSKIDPSLPDKIDLWFARSFTLEIHERFPSAKEMLAAWKEAAGPQGFPKGAFIAALVAAGVLIAVAIAVLAS